MKPKTIGVIVGSLRKAAYSRWLAQSLYEIAPASLSLREIEIGALPHYNQDLETTSPPEAWTHFRQQVIGSEGLLFVTPEYNRSMPGALKNALDQAYNEWNRKPFRGDQYLSRCSGRYGRQSSSAPGHVCGQSFRDGLSGSVPSQRGRAVRPGRQTYQPGHASVPPSISANVFGMDGQDFGVQIIR